MKKHLSLFLLLAVSGNTVFSFTPEEKKFMYKVNRRFKIRTVAGFFLGAWTAYKFPNFVHPKMKHVDNLAKEVANDASDWNQVIVNKMKEIFTRPLPPSEMDTLANQRSEQKNQENNSEGTQSTVEALKNAAHEQQNSGQPASE